MNSCSIRLAESENLTGISTATFPFRGLSRSDTLYLRCVPVVLLSSCVSILLVLSRAGMASQISLSAVRLEWRSC